MTLQYPKLTYAGDVTGSEQCQPGHLLGCDEVGRFYEVIDAETVVETEMTWGSEKPTREDVIATHVNLQYATAETMKRAAAGQPVEG